MEGKHIVIEYRYAEGKLDRLPKLAAELVDLNVDAIQIKQLGITIPPSVLYRADKVIK